MHLYKLKITNYKLKTTIMAKIKPMILIQSMSGKVCSHSDTYFALRNGTQYTGTRCNKRTTPLTQNELKNQIKFKTAHAAAVIRLRDASQQAKDMAAFRKQTRYKTILGYLIADEYAKITD